MGKEVKDELLRGTLIADLPTAEHGAEHNQKEQEGSVEQTANGEEA